MKFPEAIFLDLDETIYPEIDFKVSGFRAVARWLHSGGHLEYNKAYGTLLSILASRGQLYKEAFQELCSLCGIDRSLVPGMIESFRSHVPAIEPYGDFVEFISRNKDMFFFGVITDGLGAVQKRKIKALGIERWIKKSAILIPCLFDPPTDKHNPLVFEKATALSGKASKKCMYVSDNPAKDFIQPHILGWQTARMLRGAFSDLRYPAGAAPADAEVKDFAALEKYLCSLRG